MGQMMWRYFVLTPWLIVVLGPFVSPAFVAFACSQSLKYLVPFGRSCFACVRGLYLFAVAEICGSFVASLCGFDLSVAGTFIPRVRGRRRDTVGTPFGYTPCEGWKL